jgi:predicted lipoprotein with Yx(FWY)xxD motif
VSRTTYALTVLVVAAVAIAGCGGSDYNGSSESESESGGAYSGNNGSRYGGGEKTAAAPEGGSGGGAVVSLGNVPKLGMILVDSKGFTLYDFHKDKGTTSACYGACAEGWPPLMTEGAPRAGNGASASMLGTTQRKDGTTQVTYAGHPLYTFAGDQGPGEANGNDVDAFGAQWYALQGSGEEPEG